MSTGAHQVWASGVKNSFKTIFKGVLCLPKVDALTTCAAHSHFYSAWWIRKEWLRVKCLLLKISSMPFTVIAAMGQHLETGMTYIFQITQTQVVSVKAVSATRISFPLDSRAHSSRELQILMWRTTKSLESADDNLHKHLRSQQVKLHSDLNYLLGYNFFWNLNFYCHFLRRNTLFSSDHN